MKIQTKYFGEMDIEDSKVIQFPNGLPGFNEKTEYVLLDLPDNPLFQILQSISTDHIAFIVTNPHMIYPNYSFQLDDSILEQLHIQEEKEVIILAIVTLKKPIPESTLNLKAPIIINSSKRLGKQYILNLEEYSSTASIAPASNESEVQ